MTPKREIQVFNFAFLDILTSTLGALLFVFLLALVNQMGLIDADEIIKKIEGAQQGLTNATTAASAAFTDYTNLQTVVIGLEHQGSGATQSLLSVTTTNQLLAGEIAASRTRTFLASNQVILLQRALASLTNRPASTGGTFILPTVSGRGDSIPCHVDCTRNGLVILGDDVTRNATQRERCPTDDIDDPTSHYGRLIKRLQSPANRRVVLLFWVRPDGVVAFDKAYALARKAGVAVGYEPAEADWNF